jgi:hydroxypyruvate isomerase
MNCLAGRKPAGVAADVVYATLVDNVRFAADELAKQGLKLLVEHINYYDIPGFCLNTTTQALVLLADVGRPNAYLQYDMYHAQRMEGELLATAAANLPLIGHIQVADNPGRHEPGTGEINYRNVFAALDRLGYTGHIGLEYIPSGDTLASLAWVGDYGFSLRQT